MLCPFSGLLRSSDCQDLLSDQRTFVEPQKPAGAGFGAVHKQSLKGLSLRVSQFPPSLCRWGSSETCSRPFPRASPGEELQSPLLRLPRHSPLTDYLSPYCTCSHLPNKKACTQILVSEPLEGLTRVCGHSPGLSALSRCRICLSLPTWLLSAIERTLTSRAGRCKSRPPCCPQLSSPPLAFAFWDPPAGSYPVTHHTSFPILLLSTASFPSRDFRPASLKISWVFLQAVVFGLGRYHRFSHEKRKQNWRRRRVHIIGSSHAVPLRSLLGSHAVCMWKRLWQFPCGRTGRTAQCFHDCYSYASFTLQSDFEKLYVPFTFHSCAFLELSDQSFFRPPRLGTMWGMQGRARSN